MLNLSALAPIWHSDCSRFASAHHSGFVPFLAPGIRRDLASAMGRVSGILLWPQAESLVAVKTPIRERA